MVRDGSRTGDERIPPPRMTLEGICPPSWVLHTHRCAGPRTETGEPVSKQKTSETSIAREVSQKRNFCSHLFSILKSLVSPSGHVSGPLPLIINCSFYDRRQIILTLSLFL